MPRKVGRASLQELILLHDKPVIDLEEHNPKLFAFVQKLAHVKKIRVDLYHMKKYLTECRLAATEKILDNISGSRRYLLQTPEMYSVADLVAVESGALHEFLNKIYDVFERHIRQCQVSTLLPSDSKGMYIFSNPCRFVQEKVTFVRCVEIMK